MKKAFTLIELLIVIAIIAILALIAVPNFLEAQVRAKVSRVYADFRSISVAMNAYHVDWGTVPPDYWGATETNQAPLGRDKHTYEHLTTPVSYMTSIMISPFREVIEPSTTAGLQEPVYYQYYYGPHPNGDTVNGVNSCASGIYFRITSAGPDQQSNFRNNQYQPNRSPAPWFPNNPGAIVDRTSEYIQGLYNPTNGTLSTGDILMTFRGIEK